MLTENNIFYFLNCDFIGKEEEIINNINKDDKVISMYHVCGNVPWLIVCKFTSFDEAYSFLNKNDYLEIKNIFITNLKTLENSENITKDYKSKSWIFVQILDDKDFDIKEEENKFKILERYQVFGHLNNLFKFYTNETRYIHSFLNTCMRKNMMTSTYFVLRTFKENGKEIKADEKTKIFMTVKVEDEYLFARIIANSKNFIEKDRNYQIEEIETALSKMNLKYNLTKYISEIYLDKSEGSSPYRVGKNEGKN